MFWSEQRQRKREFKAAENERRHFERQILNFIKAKRLTVALARMATEEQYGFQPPVSGGPPAVTARWNGESIEPARFFGIVHEEYGRGGSLRSQSSQKWIHATILLSEGESNSPRLGYAHLGASASPTEKDRPRLNRQLHFEVVLHDGRKEIFPPLREALRDAAISGNQFVHLQIDFEEIAGEPALRDLKESSKGITFYVTSIMFWPDLTLPKSPSWGWRWSLPW